MPTQLEALVERYIQAAGVAAVSIDGTGPIGLVDVVRLVDRGISFGSAARPASTADFKEAIARLSGPVAPMAAVDIVEVTALRIPVTHHEEIIERAGAAVLSVEERMHALQASGALQEINRQFKRERQEGSKVSYRNFMQAKRLELVDAIARS